jgi:hypothetical protein
VESLALTALHSTGLGLPFDREAFHCCASLCLDGEVVGEVEFEHNIMGRLEDLVTRSRFSGRVCILLEAGYRAALIVLDGVVFGACLEGPDGHTVLGEEALAALEALGGPATVRLYRR